MLLSSSCAISEPANSPPLSGQYIPVIETSSHSLTNGQIQLQNLMSSETTNYLQLSSMSSNTSQSRQDCNGINASTEWQQMTTQHSQNSQLFDNLSAISSVNNY